VPGKLSARWKEEYQKKMMMWKRKSNLGKAQIERLGYR
jgi:hypothetical protein